MFARVLFILILKFLMCPMEILSCADAIIPLFKHKIFFLWYSCKMILIPAATYGNLVTAITRRVLRTHHPPQAISKEFDTSSSPATGRSPTPSCLNLIRNNIRRTIYSRQQCVGLGVIDNPFIIHISPHKANFTFQPVGNVGK